MNGTKETIARYRTAGGRTTEIVLTTERLDAGIDADVELTLAWNCDGCRQQIPLGEIDGIGSGDYREGLRKAEQHADGCQAI